MPKISVIIPVFNAVSTIKKCVDSVVSQDFPDIEILLIDDGSVDDSFSLCKDFEQKDGRIVCIKRENSGAAATRNYGMTVACGEYFMFVDSDDYLDSGALSFMYKSAKSFDADIIMCGYKMINGSKKSFVSASGGVYEGTEINKRICEIKSKNLIDSPCNKLYKADFIKKSGVVMPENEIFEDTDFNLNLLRFSPKFVIEDKCFYNYVLRMGSTTRKYNPDKLETIKKRARLLKDITSGNDAYCDFYFIKSVFSSFIDMFLSLDKAKIKENIKYEISRDEFKQKAQNACFGGISSEIIIAAARSQSTRFVYLFCKFSYIFKYKYQRLFLRVR